MSATTPRHTRSLPASLSLPCCCVSCYLEAGHELPDACILEPCARHQRGDGGTRRPPTAVGAPAPDDLPCNNFSTEALAERGIYLLEYGQDIVAQLTSLDAASAAQLSDDLAALGHSLNKAAHLQETESVHEIVRRIDEAIALAELAIRDAEEQEDAAS
jgi:hypothetical protein